MKKNFKNLLIFIIPIFILAVFYFGLKNEQQYNTKNLVGKRLNNFEIKNLNNNEKISHNDLKSNSFTLINFWATWCAPCRKEHKYLLTLKNNHDLKILGVNFKDQRDKALKYLSKYGNPYRYLAEDKTGKSSVDFGIYGIPESILIDKNLRVVMKFIGPINNSDLKKIVETIK